MCTKLVYREFRAGWLSPAGASVARIVHSRCPTLGDLEIMAIKTSVSSRKLSAPRKAVAARRTLVREDKVVPRKAAIPQRFSLSLPPLQSESLNAMADTTSLSKNELVRNAVSLLSVAHRARLKGLRLALVNDDDAVVSHIVGPI